jgi:hypothetical protein
MAYTREDMRNIFRRGIFLGLCHPNFSADELTEYFEPFLRAIRQQKAQAKPDSYDANKAIDDWIKAGRPEGAGIMGVLFPEDE